MTQQWNPAPQPTARPWGAPPPPRPPKPKKRGRWLIWVGAAVGGLLVLGALAGGPPADQAAPVDHTSTTVAPPSTRAPAAAPAEAPAASTSDVGRPVDDGQFRFTIRRFACSGGTCKAAATVENVGDQPQFMFADNQYLFDARGRRYSADSLASGELFIAELNPGLTARGTIVWKVPANIDPDHLELHDSLFSGGVTVALPQEDR